jgi:hypothetical protein
VGKPVKIHSGYRSWGYNVRLYKKRKQIATKSRHCSGRAADISIAGMTGMDIAKVAIDAWGPTLGVGINKHFAHIDVRKQWASWTYPGVGDPATRGRAKQEIDEYRRERLGAAPVRPAAKPAAPPTFLKDAADLKTAPLVPSRPIGIDRKWPSARKAAAETYNRVGGLMGALATRLGVELPAVLAVWRVESGGRTHTPGKAIIRFENHLFFRLWGEKNPARYNMHFRHGGHAGQAGKSWEGHQLRASATDQFAPIHTGSQGNEYRALELATRLAGEGIALQCISIGGPQILITNHRRLGYATPRQMYDAFQASERWQVIGFFDFCRNTKQGQLVAYLRARDWAKFAYYYNGKGQVAIYSGHLIDAYQAAQAVTVVPAREAEREEMEEQEEMEKQEEMEEQVAMEEQEGMELEWEKDPMSETWEAAPEAEWEWEVANE